MKDKSEKKPMSKDANLNLQITEYHTSSCKDRGTCAEGLPCTPGLPAKGAEEWVFLVGGARCCKLCMRMQVRTNFNFQFREPLVDEPATVLCAQALARLITSMPRMLPA